MEALRDDLRDDYLADNILHQLVHGEANVGVDSEHLPQSVLILCGVNIPIQQTSHHIQECWVVFLQLHLTWAGEESSHCRQEAEGGPEAGDRRDNCALDLGHLAPRIFLDISNTLQV